MVMILYKSFISLKEIKPVCIMSCLFYNDFSRDMQVFKHYICACRCLYNIFGNEKEDTTYVHFPRDIENPYVYRPQYGTRHMPRDEEKVPEVVYHQPIAIRIPEVIVEEEESSDNESAFPQPRLPPPPVDTTSIYSTVESDSTHSPSNSISPQSNHSSDSLDIVDSKRDLCARPPSCSSASERDVWHIL